MNYDTSYPPPNHRSGYNADYKPMPQNTDIHNGRHQKSRISGKWLEIAFCFFVMTVPMLVFSGLLLGLIYHFRIKDIDFVSPNLKFAAGKLSNDAVYVDLSATLLTTIASWSSTVAPILVGFAITLLTFPISKSLLSASAQSQPDRLPTPFQLALMVRMNTASAANSLYHWLRYMLFFRKGRSKQPVALTWMTFIIVISWLLSILVFVTDTWLHVATKSVNLIQVSPTADTQNLTFALLPGCTTSDNSYNTNLLGKIGQNVCILNTGASGTTLLGSASALQVVNNVSSTMAVQSVARDGSTYFYMGNAEQQRLANRDYSAQTYAIETKCVPVSSQCMNQDGFYGASTPYNCPFNFGGNLAQEPWGMSFFTDSSMKDNDTSKGIENPYHFALAASQNQAVGRVNKELEKDPEIMISTHGATVFVLTCSSTVYDVEYSSVNGSVTRWVSEVSNSSVANILQSEGSSIGVGTTYLQQAASLAMFSNTSSEVAGKFAQAYSRVAMSIVAGAFQSTPGLEAQIRSSIIAARVPYAPLFALVLSNLLLVVLGVILTLLAIFAAGGDTGEAQARFSIQGIVAQCFEGAKARSGVTSIDAMYDEYEGRKSQKIGVIKTEEGGWTFGTWRPAH